MVMSVFNQGGHELGDCGRGQKVPDANACCSVFRTNNRLANRVKCMQRRHVHLCCREAIALAISLEFNVFIPILKTRSYHPADNITARAHTKSQQPLLKARDTFSIHNSACSNQ